MTRTTGILCVSQGACLDDNSCCAHNTLVWTTGILCVLKDACPDDKPKFGEIQWKCNGIAI